MIEQNIRITGVMFYYFFVCPRKLWYFYHNIAMEHNSEDVSIGKLIDESSYKRENKHIQIDGMINIDFIDGKKVIHEVKKSRAIEVAGEMQLKYYLWYLKSKGIGDVTGVVDYPKLKKRKKIILTDNDCINIEETIRNIYKILNSNIPTVIKNKICKRCAYYELCYI